MVGNPEVEIRSFGQEGDPSRAALSALRAAASPLLSACHGSRERFPIRSAMLVGNGDELPAVSDFDLFENVDGHHTALIWVVASTGQIRAR